MPCAFNVEMRPLDAYAAGLDGVSLRRMALNKTFSGDLDATSQGEMLTAMTSVEGSAGYVAIEQVTGTLNGRRGSFALQHFGRMNRGASQLILEIVPDSATAELEGLAGTMALTVVDGQHRYTLDYTLG